MQDVIQLHDAKVLQHLDGRRGGPLQFGYDFLILQVVNQPIIFDERQ